MVRRIVRNYIERHRHPVNQVLHAFGVPMTFVVSTFFLLQQEWLWGAGAFGAGYLMQFAGHAIEGNDAGELILFKKLAGKPYKEFGPLSRRSDERDNQRKAA